MIKILSNGIRVVSEYIPYLKSVSIGVWVRNGSANENREENGISHFIEHMLFKGTSRRTASDISLEIDSVGGRLNAFTAAEYTCYYTKTLDAHAPLAIDILSDMLYNSKLDKKDMDLERQVIFEEIDMCTDEPEELVHDLIMKAAYGDTPLGRNILGTKEGLSNINPEMMREYLRTHYTSKNTVIAISGHFDDSIFDCLEEYFGKVKLSDNEVVSFGAEYRCGKIIEHKDSEQVQMIMAFPGIDDYDERKYPLMVFNNIFGDGMSSRLFRKIREDKGLAYSVYSFSSSYKDSGIFNISAGMNPKNLNEVIKLINEEVEAVKKNKLTLSEIKRGKEQLKGSYILSNENTGSRMQSAGRAVLMGRQILTPEEVLTKIDAVNEESVSEVIDRVFDTDKISIAAVGTVDESAFSEF